tara:strand:+ start:2332 stop:3381 length:1050 start_codon:yes stop_codon:yes gene_type:complete
MDNFNYFFPKENEPPHLCVEMSGNHQGNLEKTLAFVSAAKQAGADSLKVQVYTPDTITLNSDYDDFKLSENNDWIRYETMYNLYKKAHTPWPWIEEIFSLAKDINLDVFASPFDDTAVDFLEKLNCPIYKIASPEITDLKLIEKCAETKKPVILSTGLAAKNDIDLAVDTLRKKNARFSVLKCVSAYPTPIKDMNLLTIPWLKKIYSCPVGLSDHTIGMEAAFAATALGARFIEKHFKFENDYISVDSSFSMPIEKFESFKKAINLIHGSLGQPTLEIPEVAKPSLSGRRSLYVCRDVKKGEEFTYENVKSIRPSYGLPPKYLTAVIGKKSIRNVKKGERMSWDLVEND